MSSKTCSRCSLSKPISEFHRKKSGKYGVGARCKTCRSEEDKEYRRLNADKIAAYEKGRYHSVKGVRDKLLKQYRERKKSDPVYILGRNLSRRIHETWTGDRFYTEASMMNEVTGMNSRDLHDHLWSTFEENYGIPRNWVDNSLINADHIIPKSTATSLEEMRRLNHYTNLQLLFKEDNQKKKAKIISKESKDE